MSWLFPYVRVASKLLQAFSSSETGQRTADVISRGAAQVSAETKVVGAHISSASEKAALTRRARRVVAQLREQLDAGAISEDEFLMRAHSVVAKTGLSVAAVDESLAARLAAYGKTQAPAKTYGSQGHYEPGVGTAVQRESRSAGEMTRSRTEQMRSVPDALALFPSDGVLSDGEMEAARRIQLMYERMRRSYAVWLVTSREGAATDADVNRCRVRFLGTLSLLVGVCNEAGLGSGKRLTAKAFDEFAVLAGDLGFFEVLARLD